MAEPRQANRAEIIRHIGLRSFHASCSATSFAWKVRISSVIFGVGGSQERQNTSSERLL
jgi:hypothetical protein